MSDLGMYVEAVVSASMPFFEVYLIIWSQVGSLPKTDIDVGTGLVGAPAYVTSCLRVLAD
jgi:hypothetical protein